MERADRWREARRGGLVLAAAVLVLLAVAASPAGGAASFNKQKAKKLFYTKGQSESRFLDPTEGGASYLGAGRIVLATSGPWSLVKDVPTSATVTDLQYSVRINPNSSTDAAVVKLYLLAPLTLGLRTFGLESVSICFTGSSIGGNDDAITQTAIVSNLGTLALFDDTDRINDSSTRVAYTVSPPTPYVPSADETLALQLSLEADNASDYFSLCGVRATWAPTGGSAV